MKRLPVLLLVIALVACKEVSYKEPQPKGVSSLAQVPSKLQGSYQFTDDKGNTETIIITKRGFYAKSEPKDYWKLSDSLVMKTYENFYFISKNENPEWVLRVLQLEKTGDLAYWSMEYGEDFNGFLERLGREIQIDSTEVKDEKLYQIDPSPKELIGLLNKGYFKKVVLKKKK